MTTLLSAGVKHDSGKPRWDLVPMRAVQAIADVLAHGARKYGANNWQGLEDFEARYYAAALRHLTAWRGGEHTDPESGLPHLAHAACSVVFLLSRSLGFEPPLDAAGRGFATITIPGVVENLRVVGRVTADPYADGSPRTDREHLADYCVVCDHDLCQCSQRAVERGAPDTEPPPAVRSPSGAW